MPATTRNRPLPPTRLASPRISLSPKVVFRFSSRKISRCNFAVNLRASISNVFPEASLANETRSRGSNYGGYEGNVGFGFSGLKKPAIRADRLRHEETRGRLLAEEIRDPRSVARYPYPDRRRRDHRVHLRNYFYPRFLSVVRNIGVTSSKHRCST